MGLNNQWQSGQTVQPSDMNNIANYIMGANQSGPYASRPPPGNLGVQYYATDCDALYLDNGTAWAKIRLGGPSGQGGPPMADPPTTGWIAVNMQTGWTWAQSLDGMLFSAPFVGSSGDNWGYQYRAYPTPPFTLTAYLDMDLQGAVFATGAYPKMGLIISDGTKLITHGAWVVGNTVPSAPCNDYGFNFGATTFTTVTAYSAAYNVYLSAIRFLGGTPKWWRYQDDNTNRYLSYSLNGIDWHQIVSEARTAFLTPTRIGVGCTNYSGNMNIVMRLRSWVGVP
jgi:hypothetical protein